MAPHTPTQFTVFTAAALAFAGLSYSPEISATAAQGTGNCSDDTNGDHTVDAVDLGALLATWGQADSDGVVDAIDLGALLAGWGACPEPPPLAWATTISAFVDPAVVTNASLGAAITATGLPWRVRDNASNIEMLLVPPGTFMMGCSASDSWVCYTQENPVHQVTLTNAFYLGRTEVTQAQWLSEMGENPSYYVDWNGYPGSDARPVEQVSWYTIQGFLSQNSLRLPTVAEWEYAYRAGTTTAFHSMPGYASGTNSDPLLANIAWYSNN